MKKLLAISLSLAMALSVVGGLAITSSAADDNYLVLGDASTPDKIGTWTDGSTDIEINEGLIGMKTVTAGDVSISAGVENVDASSREYFEFYVDISEISPDAPFAIVFRMRNADGSKEYMSPSVGAGDAMQLIDANGVTEAALDDYGRIVLPAGFAGYVRMAVATFAADGLDMTAVASMVIWYGATDNEIGKTIYFNDFRFGGGTAEDEADDNYLVLGDASTPDKIGTWTDGSTDIEINEGLIGMKTVTAGDVSISAGVENVDASGREYFEFYVDISEISPDAPFAIVFRMRNADGSKEYMSPSVGAGDAMQLIDANGVTEAALDDYGRIVLPAGFAGYVRMAVATFAADGLDMTAVASMVIWYGATDNEIGKTIYFNDFRFGGGTAEDEVDDNYLVLGDASTPEKIGTWTDGSTDIEINEGLIGMKTVTAGDVSISAGVENVDASGREYFEFYVDISEVSPDAPFAIVFRMRNADGSKEYMSPSVGAGDAMQLIDANGVTEATLDDYGRIVLPAGFAGYVRMAVATFAADGLDMTAVASMVIWYGATDNEIGKTIYFNDFRFGGTATPPDDGGDDNEDDPSTDVPVVYPVQGTTPENGGEILFGNANSETGISSLTPGVTGLAVVETETGKIIQMMNTVLASDVSIAIDAPQGTSWDASEMDYFEFWVDASEMPANFPLAIGEDEYMACFGMILRVKDADGRAADSLCLGNYGPIFHQDAEGNWVESKVSEYGHIWVPAGYSGYIRISLAELGEVDSLSPYDGNGDGLPLDLSKLTHIRFWYTAQADKADTPEDESTLEKSVYFNDFKFVKGVADGDDNTGDDNTGDDNTGDDNTGADDEDNKAPDTGAVIPVAAFGLVALGAAGMVFSRKRK